jgi:hypothetical protein
MGITDFSSLVLPRFQGKYLAIIACSSTDSYTVSLPLVLVFVFVVAEAVVSGSRMLVAWLDAVLTFSSADSIRYIQDLRSVLSRYPSFSLVAGKPRLNQLQFPPSSVSSLSVQKYIVQAILESNPCSESLHHVQNPEAVVP